MRYPKIVSLTLGLILIGLGAAGGVYALLNQRDLPSTLAAGSFLQLDYIKEDAAFVNELMIANRQAERWDAAAELAAISMNFDGGLTYDFLTRYAYIFKSPQATHNYIVDNDRVKPELRTNSDQTEVFGEIVPESIKQDYLKINFAQALEIMEQAGGGAFKADHSGNYQVSLLLIKPERGVLSWLVAYRDSSGQDELIGRVNASNGSVELQ